MLCQECGDKKATIYVTKIINGVKTELHLCEKCAQEKGDMEFSFEPKFSLQNFVAGFLGETGVAPQKKPLQPTKVQCPQCGLTFAQFRQIGRFGCSNCYSAMGEENLHPLFRRIHGSINHQGKMPKKVGGTTRAKREIEKLKQELQQCIQSEEYEKAAQIRDKIRALEQELEDQERGGQ